MGVGQPSPGSRAILFPRDLFGFYGFGDLDVAAEGITLRWKGPLFHSVDEHHPWAEVTRAKSRGHWFNFRLTTQRPPLTAFVFRPRRAREALERWAPAGVLRTRGRTPGAPRGAP